MPRPPYGCACESNCSHRRRTFINRFLTYTRFVKETRRKFLLAGKLFPHAPLRGCYTLALPHYLFIASSNTCFVKETRRKISRATPAKIFAPLTTAENYIINTRAERFPAPRLSCYLTRRSPLRRTIFLADTSAGHRNTRSGCSACSGGGCLLKVRVVLGDARTNCSAYS